MDYLQFQIKRAHLRMVAFGRYVFAPKRLADGSFDDGVPDMTPARFDLLFAVHGDRRGGWSSVRGGIPQCELRERLGLAKMTVSKMLKRLEELGLVVRRRNEGRDRRKKIVSLTEEGLRRIRAAFHRVFGKGAVRKKVLRIYTGVGRHRARRRLTPLRAKVYEIFERVRLIATHFGDTVNLLYASPFPDRDD
jgi:DNA-binding MarR family transcriptional regulator